MKKNLIILLLACFPLCAFAHRDRIARPSAYSLAFDQNEVLTIQIKDQKIVSMIIKEASGRLLAVSPEHLKLVISPKIENISLLWSDRSERIDVPYKYIQMHFGTEDMKSFGEFPFIEFMFREGVYDGAVITRKDSENSWHREVQK